MRYKLLIFLIFAVAFQSILISNSHGITLNNTEFSVIVPGNWTYQESSNDTAGIIKAGPWVKLVPVEYNELLSNPGYELSGKLIENKGVYSTIGFDKGYLYRNVPLKLNPEYDLHLPKVRIISQAYTTIDGEDAIRIHRTSQENTSNVEVIDYYTVQNGKPYDLQLVINVNDIISYLPQFEQMVETFKFVK